MASLCVLVAVLYSDAMIQLSILRVRNKFSCRELCAHCRDVKSNTPILHSPPGQFRDGTIGECPVSQALENGQLLAAHTEALVHLYETNVVTNGEVVVEVSNNQLGMGNLHSTQPCAGAIMAAVLACVRDQGELV